MCLPRVCQLVVAMVMEETEEVKEELGGVVADQHQQRQALQPKKHAHKRLI